MTPTLVYIGAAAGLVPAASLQALSGGGAVFVPDDLDGELRALIVAALPAGVVGLTLMPMAGDCEAALAAIGDDEAGRGAVIALAGARAPALARAARRRWPTTTTVPAGDAFADALLGQQLVSLQRLVEVLRHECPWDREQTPETIITYTVEEVYELADAIAEGDLDGELGELGDVLLQVVLLALMLDEVDGGDLGLAAALIEEKLIRRHPHVFGDAVAATAGDVKRRWERIKVEQEGRQGIFHDVPKAAPALLQARKMQQRASAVGFDWGTAREAFPKVAEEQQELAELFAAAGPSADPDGRAPEVVHEVGDLLFATVNVARLLRVDPELALRAAAERFRARVSAAADLANEEQREWSALDLATQEAYYQRAKAAIELAADDHEGERP